MFASTAGGTGDIPIMYLASSELPSVFSKEYPWRGGGYRGGSYKRRLVTREQLTREKGTCAEDVVARSTVW